MCHSTELRRAPLSDEGPRPSVRTSAKMEGHSRAAAIGSRGGPTMWNRLLSRAASWRTSRLAIISLLFVLAVAAPAARGQQTCIDYSGFIHSLGDVAAPGIAQDVDIDIDLGIEDDRAVRHGQHR